MAGMQPETAAITYQKMMKIQYFASLALAIFVFSGCTRGKETSVQAPDPPKAVHTQEELRKTGQSETGPALQKVDPAVQTSGR